MREIRWMAFVGVLLVVLLAQPAKSDDCDQECRMRQSFFSCLTDTCFWYEDPTCEFCVKPRGACLPIADEIVPAYATCTDTSTTRIYVNFNCSPACDCIGNRHRVEASPPPQPDATVSDRWFGCFQGT